MAAQQLYSTYLKTSAQRSEEDRGVSESSSKHHQGPATEHDQRVMGQGAGAETGTGAVDLPISTKPLRIKLTGVNSA